MGSQTLTVLRYERATLSGAWDFSSREFSTSYRITALTGALGGDVLFVAGVKPNGDDVIERWAFPYRAGRRQATFVPALLPPVSIGGASQSCPVGLKDVIRGPAGQAYEGPDHRGDIPTPIRKILFDPGMDVGHFRNLLVDPEGRYLLLQSHAEDTVYRWSLPDLTYPVPFNSANFFPLFLATGSAGIPLLGDEQVSFSLYDHPVDGRVLVFQVDPLGDLAEVARVAQIDSDNDGDWDEERQWTGLEWISGDYADDLQPIGL